MAWSRWSTDIDNRCSSDLYIYDSVNECIQVEIAGRRRSNYKDNPYPQRTFEYYKQNAPEGDEWTKQLIQDGKDRNKWFEQNDSWENLPETYAGKSYSFGYGEMDMLLEFLIKARKDGINYPDYLFEIIKDYENEYQGEANAI